MPTTPPKAGQATQTTIRALRSFITAITSVAVQKQQGNSQGKRSQNVAERQRPAENRSGGRGRLRRLRLPVHNRRRHQENPVFTFLTFS